MRSSIEFIKNCIAQILYYTGFLKLILHIRFHNHAVILMYHRVLPERDDIDSFSAESLIVTPEQFEWQMKLIHQYMRPSELASFCDFFKDRTTSIPSRTCLVSFDDGWFDNYAYALPILKQCNMPAAVFVCTSYIGTGRCFWQEQLARLMHEGWKNPTLGTLIFPLLGATDLASASANAVRSRSRAFIAGLKTRPFSEVRLLLERVFETCQSLGIDSTDTGDDLFMDWNDVLELKESGVVTIGSHAVSHIPLTQLTNNELMREMTESREIIESRTRVRADALAYPNGDFSPSVVEGARQAGYRIAVTTQDGKVGLSDDPLTLRRIGIHKTAAHTPARFLCRLAGIL